MVRENTHTSNLALAGRRSWSCCHKTTWLCLFYNVMKRKGWLMRTFRAVICRYKSLFGPEAMSQLWVSITCYILFCGSKTFKKHACSLASFQKSKKYFYWLNEADTQSTIIISFSEACFLMIMKPVTLSYVWFYSRIKNRPCIFQADGISVESI